MYQTHAQQPRKRTQPGSTPAGIVGPPPPKPPQAPRPIAPQTQQASPFDDDMAITHEAMSLLNGGRGPSPQPAGASTAQRIAQPPRIDRPDAPTSSGVVSGAVSGRPNTPRMQPIMNPVPPPRVNPGLNPVSPVTMPMLPQATGFPDDLEIKREAMGLIRDPATAQPFEFPVQSTGFPVDRGGIADEDITNEALSLLNGGIPPFPEGYVPQTLDPRELGADEDDGFNWDDVFEQGADALEERLQRSRAAGMRNISEVAAARGVLGGSPELVMISDLEAELNVQGAEGLAQLNRERLQGKLQAEAMLADQRYRNEVLALQREGMTMDEAFRRAELAFREKYGDAELEILKQNADNNAKQLALTLFAQFGYNPYGGDDPIGGGVGTGVRPPPGLFEPIGPSGSPLPIKPGKVQGRPGKEDFPVPLNWTPQEGQPYYVEGARYPIVNVSEGVKSKAEGRGNIKAGSYGFWGGFWWPVSEVGGRLFINIETESGPTQVPAN